MVGRATRIAVAATDGSALVSGRHRVLVYSVVALVSVLAMILTTRAMLRDAASAVEASSVRVTEAARGARQVELQAGDSSAQIAQRLLEAGAIDSTRRFEILAQLLGWERRLEPGVYSFEPGLTTLEVARRIHLGETSPWRVTIPEGLRVEQVTELLIEAEIVTADTFTAALADPANAIGTLAAARPPGVSLEGYLAPSTFSFPLGSSASRAVRLMLERFDASMTADLRASISASGRTLHEILTIASIIEREALLDDERALISAVIWNRLAIGMPLQMDSTVQYALGSSPDQVARFGFWKHPITLDDLEVGSAHNTYAVDGLPPTPIAAPSLVSIVAAAEPADVPYLYFVGRGDGSHAFATTYEEHQANAERYRGGTE